VLSYWTDLTCLSLGVCQITSTLSCTEEGVLQGVEDALLHHHAGLADVALTCFALLCLGGVVQRPCMAPRGSCGCSRKWDQLLTKAHLCF